MTDIPQSELAQRHWLREQVDRNSGSNILVRRERVSVPLLRELATGAATLAGRALAARERLSGSDIDRIADLAYATGPRRRLDIYRSPDARAAPVIVFFYGGAWRSGAKEDVAFVGLALARRGFVVVIGDQRLVPDVRFPSFVEDSAQIVAWAFSHISEFGGDSARTLLMGHSAGAYNAVMLGLDPRYLADAGVDVRDVRGLVGLAGPYDFYPFPLQLCADAFGTAADPQQTQPVAFARAGAPPLFVAAGAKDRHVPPENTQSLCETMNAVGGACELRWYPNASHLDLLLALSRFGASRAPVLSDILNFAARHGVTPARFQVERKEAVDLGPATEVVVP